MHHHHRAFNPSTLVVGAELFQIIYILPPVFVICTAMVNLRLYDVEVKVLYLINRHIAERIMQV